MSRLLSFVSVTAQIFVAVLCISCGNGNVVNNPIPSLNLTLADKYADIDIVDVVLPDTLCSFDYDYPIRIKEMNGYVAVTFHGADSLMAVISESDGRIVRRMARVGNGPEDFIDIEFFNDATDGADTTFKLVDTNNQKMLSVNPATGYSRLFKFPRRDLGNISTYKGGYAAVAATDDSFFCIYDADGAVIQSIEVPKKLIEAIPAQARGNAKYITSPRLYVNEKKGRFIVPMYFFDIVYVFDATGTLVNTITLGNDDYSPALAINSVVANEPYIHYNGAAVTDDACFMLRSSSKPDYELGRMVECDSHIVETDWNGNPVKIYNLGVTPQDFSVDDNRNLWGIISTINGDEEIYHIVKWHID